MKEKTKKPLKFPKILTCILVPLAALFLVVGIVADCVISKYWEIIAAAFSDTEAVTDPDLMDEAVEKSLAVNQAMLEEGSVLLKNDNDTLPISSDVKKVNIYGIMSGGLFLNTSGSGAVNNSNAVTLKAAFEGAGYEVNSALWDLVENSARPSSGSGAGTIQEGSIKSDKVTEISVSAYNSASSWSTAKAFSEYAVVTFGRSGSEGGDLAKSYLTLDSSEVALLQQLHNSGFKVITLINSSHVMALGEVVQYSDAVLWIGGPGLNGSVGIVNVLSGNVSPSGRLVDTWMYDHKTNSTYYTADTYNYTGAASAGFTNYNEGIYVGYRWYETADAEGYWASKGGYEQVVAYPFGYGLSYGELSEEITNVEYNDGIFTFTVKTTNANSIPSKNVFELYVEKPYTNGGVEVSKVELIAFAKSDAITSADTDGYTTTITVNQDELASYDSTAVNGKGAYVLAGGEYKFYLASCNTGAHCWTLTDEAHCYSCELSEVVYSGDNKRSTDAVAAENQLGTAQNAIASDDNNSGYVALSRKDHFANASQTVFKTISNVSLSADSPLVNNFSETGYTALGEYKGEILENLSTSQPKKYSFADMYTTDADGNPLYEAELDEETGRLISKTVLGSVDYDDPRWDYLISQMSVDDLEVLVGRGGWMTAKIDSIDKPKGSDYDGPSGLSNLMANSIGKETKCTAFCSEPVMASTWNVDLVEELGEAVAREANVVGQSGWYAPGANIHRTPFGGRNAEYFSEDAYISGVMCAVESRGAMNLGLYCTAKHFAFNDIEANRTSMENCWVSEQAAREIYLKAYEIGCKSGDIPGLMMSYMWINGEWIGANYGLLTGIVRNEWGFNGMITTDNASGGNIKWVSPSRLIYAGGDLVLSEPRTRVVSSIKTTDEGISAMKIASKHILYTVASAYLNRLEAAKEGPNTFIPYYILINVVVYGIAAACLIADGTKITLYYVKKKKLDALGGSHSNEIKEENDPKQTN